MICNANNPGANIHLQGEVVTNVECFRYLRSLVQSDGELNGEVNSRIQAGYKNWRKLSGILCYKMMSVKLKGRVYKTVVRPAMAYCSERWPMKSSLEEKMNIAEMRMLRWMTGITRTDRIRNEYVRGTTKFTEVSRKVQEGRLS